MIRFLPDSWVDVLLRPLDMISPEGNIYVEVSAPDARLAAALLLALGVAASSAARKHPQARPPFLLGLLTLAAMVPWLITTGNGRYFIPFLLLLGPLCVGLIRLLPLSASMKLSVAVLLLLVQGVLVFESSPWGAWSLMSWRKAPYFEMAQPTADARSYVTLSPISYSLIAPQFPKESRWMNISAPLMGEREREYARQWLAKAQSLHLVAVAYPSQMTEENQPSAAVFEVFNTLVSPRGLAVVEGTRCEYLPSPGMGALVSRDKPVQSPQVLNRFGFWLCPVRYDPDAAIALREGAVQDGGVDATFEAIEKMCPRFFPPGEARTQRIPGGGATRHYSSSDTRVYVLEDGEVLYKFWRSLNPVSVGQSEAVVAGRAQLDCTKIRAPTWRSGGP